MQLNRTAGVPGTTAGARRVHELGDLRQAENLAVESLRSAGSSAAGTVTLTWSNRCTPMAMPFAASFSPAGAQEGGGGSWVDDRRHPGSLPWRGAAAQSASMATCASARSAESKSAASISAPAAMHRLPLALTGSPSCSPPGGCSTVYYAAMSPLGWAKADLLANRVQLARDAMDQAKIQFADALPQFAAARTESGGNRAARPSGAQRGSYADSAASAALVAQEAQGRGREGRRCALRRMAAGRSATAGDAGQRAKRQQRYDAFRPPYDRLLDAMRSAEASMPPVLDAMKAELPSDRRAWRHCGPWGQRRRRRPPAPEPAARRRPRRPVRRRARSHRLTVTTAALARARKSQ